MSIFINYDYFRNHILKADLVTNLNDMFAKVKGIELIKSITLTNFDGFIKGDIYNHNNDYVGFIDAKTNQHSLLVAKELTNKLSSLLHEAFSFTFIPDDKKPIFKTHLDRDIKNHVSIGYLKRYGQKDNCIYFKYESLEETITAITIISKGLYKSNSDKPSIREIMASAKTISEFNQYYNQHHYNDYRHYTITATRELNDEVIMLLYDN